jgi:hypothetical protein
MSDKLLGILNGLNYTSISQFFKDLNHVNLDQTVEVGSYWENPIP